MPIMCSSIATV